MTSPSEPVEAATHAIFRAIDAIADRMPPARFYVEDDGSLTRIEAPSEPVESREQPREEALDVIEMPEPGILGEGAIAAIRHAGRATAPDLDFTPYYDNDAAEEEPVLSLLESLGLSHARIVAEKDATIRELRAEVERHGRHEAMLLRQWKRQHDERDAALAEVSRLREQGEAVRRLCDKVEAGTHRQVVPTVAAWLIRDILDAREGE